MSSTRRSRSRRPGPPSQQLDASCSQREQTEGDQTKPEKQRLRFTSLVRVWLPLITVLSGVIAAVIGHDDIALEGGAMLVSAGVAIWLANYLMRVGLSGDKDRDKEKAARAYFDEHGHWPPN